MSDEPNGTRPAASEEERAFYAAQAKTEEFKAKEAEIRAAKAEIELLRLRDEDKWMRAANAFHRVYAFDSDVSERSVAQAVTTLDLWDRLFPREPITFQFYSPGGDVIAGMHLFDKLREMRRKGHHVTTEAYGYAASMAGILLQAGDERKMGREAYILIHEVSFGVSGKIGEVQDEVKFVEKIQGRVLDIFAENARKAKEAGTAAGALTRKEFAKRWTRKDWWLSSDEALKFGVVDAVI